MDIKLQPNITGTNVNLVKGATQADLTNAANNAKTYRDEAQAFSIVSEDKSIESAYSALNASVSATTAIYKANIATNKATEANNSAINASASEAVCIAKATIATDKADIATAQSVIATNKANEASISANTATTQAGIATTKASEASTSASNALTSENNADTSEANALIYRNQAELFANSINPSNLVHISGTETITGNKTFSGTVSGLTKATVGLSNVDNTSDANKPISTDAQTALEMKANLSSPALTGTPTAPTAVVGTNTTQLATTAYVKSEVANETYTKAQVDSKLAAQLVGSIAELKLIDGSTVNKLEVLGYYNKGDVGGGTFYWDATSTEPDNGGTIIQANGITTGRWKRVFSGYVNAKWFGAKGDGVTDDTVAIQNAMSMQEVQLENGTYLISSLITLPLHLKSNGAVITGNDCQWKEIKKVVFEGKITFVNLIIDSVWESNFNGQIFCSTITIKSTNSIWGTFWNKFDFIQTTGIFEINADGGQSINQNTFQNVKCRGGLRIYGVNTYGAREAHNNVFVNLDTTGANITSLSGISGCHILNDSNRNQTNIVHNWYAEASGNRIVFGNWNILGSHIDSTVNSVMVGRNNHYLFAGGTTRNGDFFAGTPINCAKGGSWDILQVNGRPLDVSVTGGVAVSLVSSSTSPDGNPYSMQCTATGTFQSITIPYVQSQNPSVSFTAYVKLDNLTTATVELYRGGSNVSIGRTLTPLGSDWYLLRASGDGGFIGDGVSSNQAYIRIYLTTSSLPSPAPVFTLGSFFLANEQTGFLPRYIYGRKTAYGTTVPTAGTWSVGDIVYHTSPTTGGFIGWICTTAGTPGTWKTYGAISA